MTFKRLATDADFLANLNEGKRWEEIIAQTFRDLGFVAAVTPLRLRPDVSKRREYADNVDLIVKTQGPGSLWRYDVKSRDVDFGDDPGSYPYEWVFVQNVRPWLRKTRKPHATILISRISGSVLVVPTSTEKSWRQETIRNRVQGVEQLVYECPRDLLRPWVELVRWMGDPSPVLGKRAS